MREKTAEEVKHGEAFVLTNDPCIHVMRVRSRVKAGGHDVPEGKNVSRYEKHLRNLSGLIRIADHTRVIDQIPAFDRICCFATEYAGQVSRKHGIIFLQA